MNFQDDKMLAFEFLVGDWDLVYQFPVSLLSKEAGTGIGSGTVCRFLKDRYVRFDYSCSLSTGQEEEAHAIFAWDEKSGLYRFWWFESSGSFSEASCKFIDKDTLFLNWHDGLLIQTFERKSINEVLLTMKHPNTAGEYEAVLMVQFIRKE